METILIAGNRTFGRVSVVAELLKEFEFDSIGVAMGFSYYFNDDMVVVFNGKPEKKYWQQFSRIVGQRTVIVECTAFENPEFLKMARPRVIKIVGGGKDSREWMPAKHNMWDTTVAFKMLLDVLTE